MYSSISLLAQEWKTQNLNLVQRLQITQVTRMPFQGHEVKSKERLDMKCTGLWTQTVGYKFCKNFSASCIWATDFQNVL